jgi:hypothetical protein
MHQREGDFGTAQDVCEPCSRIHSGLRTRYLIDGDQHAAQRHGAIVERNKPCHALG